MLGWWVQCHVLCQQWCCACWSWWNTVSYETCCCTGDTQLGSVNYTWRNFLRFWQFVNNTGTQCFGVKLMIFTTWCYASAVLAMGHVSVSVSVCLSVTSWSFTKTTKRMITQTRPFDWGHPLRGLQMKVGWVKIGDFPQITGYISKTIKDGHIVSIKVE